MLCLADLVKVHLAALRAADLVKVHLVALRAADLVKVHLAALLAADLVKVHLAGALRRLRRPRTSPKKKSLGGGVFFYPVFPRTVDT